jgi:hypothetical protein
MPAMTITAPHSSRLIARLRALLARRTQSTARPNLAIGPDIPRIADRDAPTWQNDQPFFLQPGWGQPDRDRH